MTDSYQCNRCRYHFTDTLKRTRVKIDGLVRLLAIPLDEPNIADLCPDCRCDLEFTLKDWWKAGERK